MTTYPSRLVGEHVPKGVGRYEVRSTTRRHRALVRAGDAAVVLGVLGYRTDEPLCRASATELLARARAWLAHHDPSVGTGTMVSDSLSIMNADYSGNADRGLGE